MLVWFMISQLLHLILLTCELHEVVEVLYLEDGLPELPEVELEDAGDGVDVGGVGGVCEGVVAALEAVAEVVDLDLRAGHAEDAVVVQPVQVDDPHAAPDDQRDVLWSGMMVGDVIFMYYATKILILSGTSELIGYCDAFTDV